MRGTRRAILRDIHESNLDPKVAHTQVNKLGKLVHAGVDKKDDSKELNNVVFAKSNVAKSDDVIEPKKEKEEKTKEKTVETLEQTQELPVVEEEVNVAQPIVEAQDLTPLIQEESEPQVLKVETDSLESASNKKKVKKKN